VVRLACGSNGQLARPGKGRLTEEEKGMWGGFMRHAAGTALVLLLCSLMGSAQSTSATSLVPPLVNFSAVLTDVNGKPLTGVVGVTFSLYKDQQNGSPLWMETQNVQADSHGRYSVMLGASRSTGLPADIFAAGEAHWLSVQAQGQAEQPRIMLLSVPYALKAGDAQTLGGLPPSAFILAPSTNSSAANENSGTAAPASPDTSSDVTTTGGTANTLPLFTTSTNIQNSAITQTGSGTTAKVGIITTTPVTTLDVKGSGTIRGTLSLPPTATATSSTAYNSQPFTLAASAFNSSSNTAAKQTFQWQAEPEPNTNDTPNASGTLNLLFGSGTSKPAETGLWILSDGQIRFATGQTFPGTGTGDGTITGVTAGTGLSGGGTSGNVPLSINASVIPQLGANNTFTGTQTINNITTITATNSSGVLQVTNTGTSAGNPTIVATTNSTNASAVKGVASATSGTSNGVYGVANNSTGASNGVYGVSNSSSGYGVQGSSPNVGVYGSSSGISLFLGAAGVMGVGNYGVHGQAGGGSGLLAESAGVWGDTGGASQTSAGVFGSADDNNAGYFENDSGSDTSGSGATLSAFNGSLDYSTLVFQTANDGGGGCVITTGGDLSCTGSVSGAVRAGEAARRVMVHAVQSPENWFEDFGSGTLANGTTTVALDPTFASTVNTKTDYHVFLTPKGDCKGLYVASETAAGFEVRELGGGQSSVAFDYRIVAKRAGYENRRLEDVTERYQKMQEDQRLRRERMEQRSAERSSPAPIAAVVNTPR
jgi:hypothetical protein